MSVVVVADDGYALEVEVWDLVARERHAILTSRWVLARQTFSPDSKSIAVAQWGGPFRIWSLESSMEVFSMDGFRPAANGITFSPDGKTLATGGQHQGVKLWHLATRRELATIYPDLGGIVSLDFTRDGNSLLVGTAGNLHNFQILEVPTLDQIDEEIRTAAKSE